MSGAMDVLGVSTSHVVHGYDWLSMVKLINADDLGAGDPDTLPASGGDG